MPPIEALLARQERLGTVPGEEKSLFVRQTQ
jgi:hypothetical protein